MQAIPDLIAMLVLAIVSADISLSLLRPAIITSREVGLYLGLVLIFFTILMTYTTIGERYQRVLFVCALGGLCLAVLLGNHFQKLHGNIV